LRRQVAAPRACTTSSRFASIVVPEKGGGPNFAWLVSWDAGGAGPL